MLTTLAIIAAVELVGIVVLSAWICSMSERIRDQAITSDFMAQHSFELDCQLTKARDELKSLKGEEKED